MSASPSDGLAQFLSGHWDAKVRIEGVRLASAGARRRNLLFDALRGDERIPLVATVVPGAVQIMDIAVEAGALVLAEEAGVPVPHVHAVCDDPAFLGGPFFLTARIDGETIPRRVLRLVDEHEGLGARLGSQCGEALARLHAVDPDRAPPQLLRPGSQPPAEHALTTLEPMLDAMLQPSPSFALGFRWLERHCPAPPEKLSVLHGDFRNGNMIVDASGLRGVLDWEICRIGDGMEDLGWLCQRMWRFRNDSLEVGGFAGRDALREGYQRAGGRFDDASLHWWKVLSTVRWGIGLAGQAAAHLDGSVRSVVMAASGRRVAELEYDTLMLIRRAYED